jgi:hypothetical protein
MSHNPGMTNFPEARTIRAPAGISVDAVGPRAAIRSPVMTILLCAEATPLRVSISVQSVIPTVWPISAGTKKTSMALRTINCNIRERRHSTSAPNHCAWITSFRHKGLKQMFEEGQVRLIDPSLRVRVANILAVLDAASSARSCCPCQSPAQTAGRPAGSLVC